MNKVAIVVSLILAVVLGGVAFVQFKKSLHANTELFAVRSGLEDLTQALSEKDGEIEKLNQRIDRLKDDALELPGLRGEVTQLRTQIESLTKELAEANRKTASFRSRAEAERADNQVRSEGFSEAVLTLAQLPPNVRSKINAQYPGAKIGELIQVIEEGVSRFKFEGRSANDRYLRASLDENGEIVEQELEMRFNELPDAVRRAAGQQLGRDGGINMNQVWEDGRTRYQGNAEQNGQEMHYVFSETGDLLRYETWVEEPEFDE